MHGEAWRAEKTYGAIVRRRESVSKHHVKLAIGVVVIVTSIAYLLFSGATGNTMYYLTVPEVQQKGRTLQGEAIRVAGKITADPIAWDVRNLSLGFMIGDAQTRMPVRYKGVKPICSRPGSMSLWKGVLGTTGYSRPPP